MSLALYRRKSLRNKVEALGAKEVQEAIVEKPKAKKPKVKGRSKKSK